LEVNAMRYSVRPLLLVLITATALGAAGCSANRSVLPGTAAPFAKSGLNRVGQSGVKHQYPGGIQMAFLMTDGTVLVQSGASSWYRYAPDTSGGYSDGTFTQVASLPAGYGPSAYSSQVLADGRFVITGGEYNTPSNGYPLQLTNLGAVYDPVAETWTSLGHPHRWKWIGDSPSSMLPDGRLLLGQKLTRRDAALDPKTLQWTTVSDDGKADFNAEEGWTLLPDGTILTADVKNAPNSEIYNPATGKWKTAGSTIVDLHSPDGYGCIKYGPKTKDCYDPPGEIGPAMLRPDGTVFATGSASGQNGSGPGHTAIYHTKGSLSGTWTVGPDFPNNDNAGDSYAILEPSGNVLVIGVSYVIWEFDGTSFKEVANNVGPPILLPTGQLAMFGQGSVSLYTPTGKPKADWAPTIKSYPKSVKAGKTYKITGTQFTGLSQAMAFGDELQNSTSYPLVRITNHANGHVFYARTHDHSTMGVATGSKLVWTYFDVPKSIDAGASTLEVVANGIPSKAVDVTVYGLNSNTVP
jgi:hypothetical protein